MEYKEAQKYWESLDVDTIDGDIRWRFFGHLSPSKWERGPYNTAIDAIPVLDNGYVALLDHMGTDIDVINAARVSFAKSSNNFGPREAKLLEYLWTHRHTSPFEMVEFKFVVKCPIFIARQWMRHRTWSYNEVSRRYTNEDMDFYIPDSSWIRAQSESDRQASVDCLFENDENWTASAFIQGARDEAEDRYNELLSLGIAREQARMVLPQSMYTTFYAKTDLSNLLHFLELRMDPHAQWEIQQYAEAILEMIANIVPATVEIFMEGQK